MSNLVNREFTLTQMKPQQNHTGTVVEKYLPRKCSATSKLIGPKDFSSVQIFVPEVNEDGTVNSKNGFTVALSGFIRDKGRADYEFEKILRNEKIVPMEE